MRLIDAHGYCKELKNEMEWPGRHPEFISAIECAIADLGDMPTIEAEPIVHAFWKKRTGHGVYWYACSNCDEDVPKGRYGQDYFSRRCPHCGAHMDFESEEADG